MKKAIILSILLFFSQEYLFAQNPLYAWKLYDDNGIGAIMIFKFNQTSCSYDTISSFTPDEGCDIAGYCRRGNSASCDYLFYPLACPNDTGILFMGLNQDTSFFVNSGCGLYGSGESEYNSSDNCLYIVHPDGYLPQTNTKINKYNLATGLYSTLCSLPYNMGNGYGNEEYRELCTIDLDSNFMYCVGPGGFAKVDLFNGNIDSLGIIIDSVHPFYGFFFDRDRRIILGIGRNYPQNNTYLISINSITGKITTIVKTLTPLGDYTYAYDDENDIYTICSSSNEEEGDKYYFYNTLSGAFIDSCTTINEGSYSCFSPRCANSSGINEKQDSAKTKPL